MGNMYERDRHDHEKCEKDKCEKVNPMVILKKLLKEYREVEDTADENFEEALCALKDAIEALKMGVSHGEYGDKTGDKIDNWLDKYMNCYLKKCDKEECNKLREKLHDMICETERLEDESLELAKEAAKKLAKSRKLNEKLHKLQKEVADNCYPRKKTCDK